MSPQSHRGRSGSGRKGRGHIDYTPRPKPTPPAPAEATPAEEEPAEETSEEAQPASARATGSRASEAAAEARSRAEARRAARTTPGKRKRQHGLVWRWVSAYLPLMAGLFVLLAAVWVYTTYLKPPTPQQQWQTIEQKWSPEREKARADLAVAATAQPFDVAKYQQAVRAYQSQIKGWTDAVNEIKDWGDQGNITENLANFQNVSESYQQVLDQLAAATTAQDIAALGSNVQDWDQQFTGAVNRMRTTWNLALPSASPSPLAFPSVAPTESPAPSGSPAPSESPAVTPAPTETPTPAPSATPAASAS